nr:hypothetical protein [Tanacetum cinerariifolium]
MSERTSENNSKSGNTSEIYGMVQRYMDQQMNEAVKIIKEQVKEQVKVQVYRILPKIEKTVNEQLEAKVLTRSSNSSKASYAIVADLSEIELKKILSEKMESNKSIHRSDRQRNLYKALVEAYKSDKIILDTYGDIVTVKRRRDDDANKDEEPSTGSDRGSKRRREGKEPELTSAPKEKATRNTGKSTQGYMDQQMNEAVKIIKEQVKEQVKVQVYRILPKIEKTVNEQLEAKVLTRSSNSSKASYAIVADLSEIELKKILSEKMESNKSIHRSDRQRNLYKALVEAYKSDKIILDTYGDIVTVKRRRDDDANKDEEPSTGSDRGSKRRREGKEPELTTGPTYELMKGSCKSLMELEFFLEEVYKATTDQLDWNNPEGQQYPHNNKDKENMLIRIDELQKFSDGPLNDVRTALDDRLKGIRMKYLPQAIRRKSDKERAASMIQAIDKQLKTRRIMRRLEKFVGGRLYERDFMMLQQTI